MISIDKVSKTFNSSGKKNIALANVSLEIKAGERVALLGASGSGKSTLIRGMCGLEVMDQSSGHLNIGDQTIQIDGRISKDIRKIRNSIGVIFQQFNLVNQLDVITNVLIGLCPQKNIFQLMGKIFSDDDKARALDALEKVGLSDVAYQRASTLSGGQQQRVAVARALVKGAKVLLADEPVASLDPESSRKVMETLVGLSEKFDLTLITSLHQIPVAKKYCERTIALNKGKVVFDGSTSLLDASALANLYGSQISDFDIEDEYLSDRSKQIIKPQLVLVN